MNFYLQLLLFSLLVTTLTFIDDVTARNLLIVFGQGHFFLTYLYQFKAGKINKRYILWYAILAPIILTAPWYLSFQAILYFTAIIFAIHFFYDEARLLAGGHIGISLLMLIPPVGSYISVLLFLRDGIDLVTPAVLLSFFIVGLVLLRFGLKKLLATHLLYINAYTAMLFSVYYFNLQVSATQLLASIILMHYITWYVFQFCTFRKYKPASLKKYLQNVLVANVVVIILFITYLEQPHYSTKILFEPVFFYCWTVLHIIFSSQNLFHSISVRIPALKNVFRISG